MIAALAVAVVAVGVTYYLLAGRQRQLEPMDAAVERSVLAAYEEMAVAAERVDADALYQHVRDTNRGALVTAGRIFMTRAEALAETRRGFERIASVKYHFTQRHVTLLAPDTALIVAAGTSDFATPDNRTFSIPFVQSVIMTRDKTGWRVLHTHQSSPPSR